VVYLDSDMAFFDDPEPIFDAAFGGSVGIIPHRYSPRLGHLRKYGTYNVGWVMFRNDHPGRTCSAWWRDATIDWCHDYPDAGRYADQGYLDRFNEVVAEVRVLDDPGLNVAPWNLGGHDVRLDGDRLVVDGASRLVFFHFQGLRHEGGVWYPNLRPYRTRLDPLVRESIYEPYIAQLMAIEAGRHAINRGRPLGVRTTASGSRDHFGWRARARRARRVAVNALDRITGQVIRDDMVATMPVDGDRVG
jgi:hypothetical protein